MSNLKKGSVEINGKKIQFEGDIQVLKVARDAKIDIPTFCHHSHLSTFGACRLCVVEVEGMGIQASCSLKAIDGMKIKTHSEDVRRVRKVALELILANHDQSCPTCSRSSDCTLRELSSQFGIDQVRFPKLRAQMPLDNSSPSIIRDPNKCVLCGDCVRYCSEIQGVGAIDFVNRGSRSIVTTAFDQGLSEVECVNCGGCAAVCPVGAITAKLEIAPVWKALFNKNKKTIVQIAPACQVALGEMFGMKPGANVAGKMVTALKMLGFHQVYTTAFTADLTVIEETNEFLTRFKNGEKLPIFTSCCPAWVSYAEQFLPETLPNLSSCKSPQQMFSSIIKEYYKEKNEEVTVVSIMPCVAKKQEADRPEFSQNSIPDTDYVLTTQEIGKMIKEAGIQFSELSSTAFDSPFGIGSGAGMLFANSGGVSEAVLRYAADKLEANGDPSQTKAIYNEVRENDGLLETSVNVAGIELKCAVVFGLERAKQLAIQVKEGKKDLHIIEVMACPGGCVAGPGQPYSKDFAAVAGRTHGIYNTDQEIQIQRTSKNQSIDELYKKHLGEVGGHRAHKLLHTHYHSKARIIDDGISLLKTGDKNCRSVKVCLGTSCFVKGSQKILSDLTKELEGKTDIELKGTFCTEHCIQSPNIVINDKVHSCNSAAEVMKRL